MNFFEAQARARRNTGWLIFLFALAVCSLILLTNVLIVMVIAYSQSGYFTFSLPGLQNYFRLDIFFAVTAGISLLIFGSSLFKTLSLSSGGSAVAEMLGGKPVPQDTNDLRERRLLNVVEEMAIAAGMPVPRVYILDESSINAFAAGLSPASAVIGITRGTMTLLSREELQGVIAHEFSHILNGDMRLNIRLIGLLFGILSVGIIGYYMVRSVRFSGRSKNSKAGSAIVAMLAIGAGLMVIGYSGTFFGQWIKAVVSRQREYLADASAVQFTRNKDSIAGALKKIGGSNAGSALESSAAPEYSHAYFASGVSSFWQALFATHPPLERRIKSIDPGWNGEYVVPKPVGLEPAPEIISATQKKADKMILSAAILSSAEQAINQIGTLNEANVEYVRQLIITIPDALRTAAQSPYSARAVVYVLLIRSQKDKTLAWSLLDQHADRNMAVLAKKLYDAGNSLEEKQKLPLLELSVNALLELSSNQYLQFERCVNKIICADKKVDLNEWIIQRLVLQQLEEHFGLRTQPRPKYANLAEISSAVTALLSLIAHIEHAQDNRAEYAFDLGKKSIGMQALQLMNVDSLTLDLLNQSLDSLMRLKPLAKPQLLKAFVTVIFADNRTTTRGVELIRTISACLDCPMPPMQINAAPN